MNRLNTPQEAIVVLQGFADGKEIQMLSVYEDNGFMNRTSADMPDFLTYFYRVKPEPREWDVLLGIDGEIDSRDNPEFSPRMIRVVEILD